MILYTMIIHMTSDDIKLYIDTKKELEFLYNSKKYTITYSKDKDGNKIINFGELYSKKSQYDSYEHLMNEAKIDNSFFRFMLDDINTVN